MKINESHLKLFTQEEVDVLMDSCSNLRDKLLIQLLWESGFYIGDCLALRFEDFIIDKRKINVKIRKVKTQREIDVSPNLMNLFVGYIAENRDKVDTPHVFIKLSRDNRYVPMKDYDVALLLEKLGEKTGIHVTTRMFRYYSRINALMRQIVS